MLRDSRLTGRIVDMPNLTDEQIQHRLDYWLDEVAVTHLAYTRAQRELEKVKELIANRTDSSTQVG